MNVMVVGAGYVGLVQAAVLAEIGHKVVCLDVDQSKIEKLNLGEIPIYEPGLSALILDCVKAGTLSFTTNYNEAMSDAEVVFIAVGTPPGEDGSADLRYVKDVARRIAGLVESHVVLVTKSTVPVSTGDQLESLIDTVIKERLGQDVQGEDLITVVSNPEFLKEGSALSDCRRPDRIIIGSSKDDAIAKLKALYAPLNRNHDKVIVMGRRDAEFTKYAANCMLATKISFINEMSQLASRMGVDIEQVRKGIGSDPRIGFHFIYPGCGYGGSCFPKDVQALIRSASSIGYSPLLLSAVEAVNHNQKQVLPDTLITLLGADLTGRTIAVWGLSFKPNTDDLREAPSLVLIDAILSRGGKVKVFDPEAMDEARSRIYPNEKNIVFSPDRDACLAGADALVLCTEWKIFQAPNFAMMRDSLSSRIVIDGRNLYDPDVMKSFELRYYAIGRGLSVFN